MTSKKTSKKKTMAVGYSLLKCAEEIYFSHKKCKTFGSKNIRNFPFSNNNCSRQFYLKFDCVTSVAYFDFLIFAHKNIFSSH